MKREPLEIILTLPDTIDFIGNNLGSNLEFEEYQGLKAFYTMIKSDVDTFEFSDLFSDLTADLELKAFYLGMDFVLRLMGRKGILDSLPDAIKPVKGMQYSTE